MKGSTQVDACSHNWQWGNWKVGNTQTLLGGTIDNTAPITKRSKFRFQRGSTMPVEKLTSSSRSTPQCRNSLACLSPRLILSRSSRWTCPSQCCHHRPRHCQAVRQKEKVMHKAGITNLAPTQDLTAYLQYRDQAVRMCNTTHWSSATSLPR